MRLAAAALALALAAGACTGGAERAGPSPAPTPTASPTGARSPGLADHLAAARWRELPAAPIERLEVAAAAIGGRVHVAGGLVPGGASAAVEVLDVGGRSWSRAEDLPIPLHHAMAVSWRGAFVVLGGFTPGAGGLFGSASDRVFALGCPAGIACTPIEGSRWVELPRLRVPRGAGAAGVVGGAIVVAAGQGGGRLIEETEVLDPDAGQWRDGAPIPTARDHVAAASDGEHLYVAGGRRLSIGSVLGAFERYEAATDRWERLPALPTPRGGFGAAATEHLPLIVTAGGEGPRGTYDDAQAYIVPERRWVRLAPLPLARHGIGVAVVGKSVVVVAGGPRAGASVSSRVDAITL